MNAWGRRKDTTCNSNLIINGKLHDHLATLNEQTCELMDTIIRQMHEAEGVNGKLYLIHYG
ncbi:MAG: TnpV protein [Aristaeellaceae bacterium]